MKILTAEQMQAADSATFLRAGVPSLAIMESAGRAVAETLLSNYGERVCSGVSVFAGGGNNGGDGYVLARALLNLEVPVTVFSLKPISLLGGDVEQNAKSYLSLGGEAFEFSEENLKEIFQKKISAEGVIVDALFGTGFSGEITGIPKLLIEALYSFQLQNKTPVLAIDIPSGVDSSTGKVEGVAVQADATVAIQCLKMGHVLFPGSRFCGDVFLADVGIINGFDEVANISSELITQSFVLELLQDSSKSSAESHKGQRGHVLVVGGSAGHYGAPKMSAKSALFSGAGLVTMLLPKTVSEVIAPELQELMCVSLPGDSGENFSGSGVREVENILERKNSLIIGPGLGQEEGAKALLSAVIEQAGKREIPLVIDADGLNILSQNLVLRKKLFSETVLTPHPGEMAKLLGQSVEEVQENRLESALSLSAECGCVVVLKGARTVIADPSGNIRINPTATEALATAGSGDVLAGVIAGLLARGISSFDAAVGGVFLHGRAGELLFEKHGGSAGIIAGDIICAISELLNVYREGGEKFSDCRSPKFIKKVLRA